MQDPFFVSFEGHWMCALDFIFGWWNNILFSSLSKRRQINLRGAHYNRGQKQFSGWGRRPGIGKAGFLDQPAFCCVTLCKGNSPHYHPSSFLQHTPIQDTFKTKLHAKSCMTKNSPGYLFLWGIFLLPVNTGDGLGHYCTKTLSKQQANQLESLGNTEIQIIINRKHCLAYTIQQGKKKEEDLK